MKCKLTADATYCTTLLDIKNCIRNNVYSQNLINCVFQNKVTNKLKYGYIFMTNNSYFCTFVIVFCEQNKTIFAFPKIYLSADFWGINLVQIN